MFSLTPSRFVLLLICLSAGALFFELGRMDVWMDNEGQRTAPPAEMIRSGEYLVPTINGQTYLNKPPLLYWVIAAVYRVTGTTAPWAARVPTALSAVALVLAVYGLMRGHIGEVGARWAALLLLASPYFLQRARWAELDVPLVLCTFVAIMLLYKATLAPSKGAAVPRTILAGFALAAAILLKGPVPFLFLWGAMAAVLAVHGGVSSKVLRVCALVSLAVFGYECLIELAAAAAPSVRAVSEKPIALIVVMGVWTVAMIGFARERRGRVLAVWIGGAIIGVACAAPWGIAVVATKGWPFIQSLLDEQVVERVSVASEINFGFAWYFLVALPVLCAPWGLLFVFHVLPSAWKRQAEGYRFCLVAGWLSVLVFSLIAGKEYEYILPAFPFLLAATGCLLAAFRLDPAYGFYRTLVNGLARVLLVFVPVVCVAGAIYVAVTFGVLVLTVEMAIIAGLAIMIAWRGWADGRARWGAAYGLSLLVALAVLVVQGFHYTGDNSPKAIASLAGDLARAGYTVETTKAYPAVAYYAETVIPERKTAEEIEAGLQGEAPYYCLTREEFLPVVRPFLPEGVANPLFGPIGFKDLVIVGNKPLPEGGPVR